MPMPLEGDRSQTGQMAWIRCSQCFGAVLSARHDTITSVVICWSGRGVLAMI
jgi:hypothetical protein